jgi:pimeloyl-ACP methyl ester carboxylesterase
MLTAIPVHPEGPRYATPVVYLPGLWAGPAVCQPMARHLGHRGWQGTIVDLREVPGGIAIRAAAVADHVRDRATAPVLIGYDAGALVALAVAARVVVRALVLVSPLRPGAPATHALTWSRSLVWSLFRRRPVSAPAGAIGEALTAGLPPDLRATLGDEDPRILSDLARRSRVRAPRPTPPTLVLYGSDDPLVPREEARRLADDLGAEPLEAVGQGHWPLSTGPWQTYGDRVHRWLVQRLGDANLELYAEAMAERGDGDDEP